ncbi:hypothetical protein PpBr36_05515 [Pyricularia pennisetigena]|uniref:hypothetical protein n=1 Tax=Pyricularia pennisetigena TaxID=1578925 RepID=UPI00115182E1|nr:hypothetical protein PpBr36_05515 [Pyricularia pennisetigena]TLS26464.1 hypothetical protein PpBr36_05515 [Pyricularia pennisetigena]
MGVFAQLYEQRWGLAVLAVGFYLATKIHAYFKLSAFKGPVGVGFFNLWNSWAFLSRQSHLKYKEACEEYGSIVRIGPNDLLTSSPELLMHMSGVRSPYYRSSWFYKGSRPRPGIDNVFSSSGPEGEATHTRKRQQLAPGYAGKESPMMESMIDEQVATLARLLRDKYRSSEARVKPVDMGVKLSYFTLDVISALSLGKPFGDLASDSDRHGYMKATEQAFVYLNTLAASPFASVMQIPLVYKLVGPQESDRTGVGKIVSLARQNLEERLRHDTKEKSDMVASFVRHGLSFEELVTEGQFQIVAGSDTTAAALKGVLLFLLSDRRVYNKLQAEVDDAARRLGLRPDQVVADSDARALPYLQAVIREGMRCHPPVTLPMPKMVPAGGDTVVVDGREVFLPGGTHVSYAAWALHMRRDVYGEDATCFRPERWLAEEDPDRLARMQKTHELNFGYGKYQCLGKQLALMELNKVMFQLLRNFDLALTNPVQGWKKVNFLGIFSHGELLVTVSERARDSW